MRTMSIFSRKRILTPRKTQNPNHIKRLGELKAIRTYLSDVEMNLNAEIRKLEEKLFIIKFLDKTQ